MSKGKRPELDLDVIHRALADSHSQEFAQFFARYGPTVQSAVGIRVNPWTALTSSFEDILQDVWVGLLRDAQRRPLLGFGPSYDVPFSVYLHHVAIRLAWNACKKILRHPTEELDAEPDDCDWDFTHKMLRAGVSQRIAEVVLPHLNEDEAWFFTEHFVKGESIQEVGAARGKSANTSHVYKGRLERKLVKLVKKLLGLDPTKEDDNE